MNPGNTGPWFRQLKDEGYCVIPDLVTSDTITQLKGDLQHRIDERPFCEGDFYGRRTKRLGSLPRRSAAAIELVLQPLVLALAREVLGPACDCIQLNVAQLIEIHPGEVAQFPHRDDDMWPVEKQGKEFLLNVIWPLDRFCEENGATRIYPGSHRQTVTSLQDLGTPVVAECDPGAAICFLGSTIHGAGANRSQAVRRGIVIGYSLGWLKPHENPWLAYPPEVARNFPRELAELAGYIQHRPNLGNHEGCCPSLLLEGQDTSRRGASDALRPEQRDAVAAFAAEQHAGS